jgi:ATP-dependent Zn protease
VIDLVSLDIPLPDFESRKALLQINLKDVKLTPDVNIDEIAKKFEGYSGADLTNVRITWSYCILMINI